ncbi:reticulon-1-A isoform X4 [Amia ocellicauda]|uniref:reticulon-1-A isoform X4 n=1 Tax=Amia ocellicauda TaxID=2972642 RepID=UPI0034643518
MEDAHISSTTARSDEHQEDYEQRDRNQLFEEAAGYLLGENNEAEPRKVPEDDILDLTGGPPMDDFYSRKREDPVPDIWSDSPSSFSLDPSSNKLKEPLKPPFAEPAETKTKAGEVEDKILKPETPKAAPRSPAKEASPPGSSSPYEPIFPSSAPSQPLAQSFAVVDLLYWRDIKKTGVVFGASLFLLLSLTVCSIVSVCSYMALALLSVTITFRIYKGVLQAVQKSDDGHPFKAYLNSDVALSEDLVHKYSDVALSHLNCGLKELRRLFLVEDLVDSLKFAVLMWILTYVGALFNGLTLLILALIAVFSAPVIYERHQAQIDHYVGLVNNQVKDIVAKVQAKVPGLKRKPE